MIIHEIKLAKGMLHKVLVNKSNFKYLTPKFPVIYNVYIYEEVPVRILLKVIRVFKLKDLYLAEYIRTDENNNVLNYVLENKLFEIYTENKEFNNLTLKMNLKTILNLIHEI